PVAQRRRYRAAACAINCVFTYLPRFRFFLITWYLRSSACVLFRYAMSIASVRGHGAPLALWLTIWFVYLTSIALSFGLFAPFGRNLPTSATTPRGFASEVFQPRSDAFRKATTASLCAARNLLFTASPCEARPRPYLFGSR